MKAVRFDLSGDLEIEVQADPSDGDLRIEVTGIDDSGNPVAVHGWFTPRQAREFAVTVIAAADDADPRDTLLTSARAALKQARQHPEDAGTQALVKAALDELERLA